MTVWFLFQERISPTILSQIREELQEKSFPEICESIDKLDIAITFMKSIGADHTESLCEFLVQTLKIENAIISRKVNVISTAL